MQRRQALALAAAAACCPAWPATARRDDLVVRLGQSAPLVGPNGSVGRQFRDAALAWFAQSAGSASGPRVELTTLDDGGQVERATINAKLLTSEHKAIGLFGFVGAGANREGMQVAREEGVPFIAAVSGMDALRQPDNSHVFLLRAGHREEIRQIIRHTSTVGINRVALLFEYESAGWEMRDSFDEAARAAALASAVSASVSRGSTDVAAAVATLVAARPQAMVLGANPGASAAFVAAARQAGFTGGFYTLSTVGGQALLDQLGPLAVGTSVSQVVPFPWNGGTPVAREFQHFCSRHQIVPDFASMEGYLAARWLTTSLARARAREASSTALAAALERLAPTDINGFQLTFNPQTRSASAFVELTVVSSALRFMK
ncbi:MAG: ABC transporter substrate-binding protein [Ramlibacter sp.]